ncbi:glycosyltransferase [Hyunsoonleella pacifica]|uniref:Glycosyltransferase n=1 Tax=Hyunsoonleella pacifica TaxID=1080224 RepID=A0A4Q9FN55_9FLAO|nr:glycosyltransferase [Hyunsoonleella pacifica]TBN15687.1 glycosyltransferase [Hyunsoonleella pacifica]GGD21820.1 glycosyl transferase [Hyunsoonleella pacifica]
MKKRILVAPLNWGLGHATRSIPILKALDARGFQPIIASDGLALTLLQKEFPEFSSIELPSYDVTYSKKGSHFKLKMIKDSPKLVKAIKAEKKAIRDIVETHNISGIISDNRLGVYNKHVPCTFITHQLNVLSGTTTWFSTKLHEKYITRFNECWVPDAESDLNLSGKLGHKKHLSITTKYMGPISRFTKMDLEESIDLLVLLSGPEPQRSLLEDKLLKEVKNFSGNVVVVRGVPQKQQTIEQKQGVTIYNFMTSNRLEKTINQSKLVLSRSGYTTIMDLAKLEKKAFFIPTPGQTEQEYLAKRLTQQGFVPSCSQKDFSIFLLNKISEYKGLKSFNTQVDYKDLFSLF